MKTCTHFLTHNQKQSQRAVSSAVEKPPTYLASGPDAKEKWGGPLHRPEHRQSQQRAQEVETWPRNHLESIAQLQGKRRKTPVTPVVPGSLAPVPQSGWGKGGSKRWSCSRKLLLEVPASRVVERPSKLWLKKKSEQHISVWFLPWEKISSKFAEATKLKKKIIALSMCTIHAHTCTNRHIHIDSHRDTCIQMCTHRFVRSNSGNGFEIFIAIFPHDLCSSHRIQEVPSLERGKQRA